MNPLQRKQALFRAKALAQRLQSLNKRLTSPRLDEKEFESLKAEVADIKKRFQELGIDDSEE